jgi:hypothetical protein
MSNRTTIVYLFRDINDINIEKKDPVKYKQSNTVNWCFLTIEDVKDMGFFWMRRQSLPEK